MAKSHDFAEKARKASQEKGVRCPVCNTIKIPTLVVQSVKSSHGSYRFNRQRVQICKCNDKQYYA